MPADTAERPRDVKVIHFVRHAKSTANAVTERLLANHPEVLYAMAMAEQEASAQARSHGVEPRLDPKAQSLLEKCYEAMDSPEHFDAQLTLEGVRQATALARCGEATGRPTSSEVELIVTSAMSRALHTAALAFPSSQGYPRPIVCLDELREFAGPPVSERRRSVSALRPHLRGLCLGEGEVDLSLLTEEDELWRPAEEPAGSAYARADRALRFLLRRPERVIVCVGHSKFMQRCLLGRRNRNVVVEATGDERERLWRFFQNAEVRSVEMWRSPATGKVHVRPLPKRSADASSKL